MRANKLAQGTYVNASISNVHAKQFAKDNDIHALDGTGLLALIAKSTPEQHQALLAVAYENEYWRPT